MSLAGSVWDLIAILEDQSSRSATPGLVELAAILQVPDNDKAALLACLSASSGVPELGDLAEIVQRVFVATGSDDATVGDPQIFVAALPLAEALVVPAANHVTVLEALPLKQAAISFLSPIGG